MNSSAIRAVIGSDRMCQAWWVDRQPIKRPYDPRTAAQRKQESPTPAPPRGSQPKKARFVLDDAVSGKSGRGQRMPKQLS